MKFLKIGQAANMLELPLIGTIISKESTYLQHFGHKRPRRLQNSPHPHVAPIYGAKAQYVEMDIPSAPLDKEGQKLIQAVTGTLLYYSRAVDPTMLVTLNAVATQQASPMQKTMDRIKHLLDYCSSQKKAIITYHSSDMVLAIHSNAGYLNESKARSRVGEAFFSFKQYPISAK